MSDTFLYQPDPSPWQRGPKDSPDPAAAPGGPPPGAPPEVTQPLAVQPPAAIPLPPRDGGPEAPRPPDAAPPPAEAQPPDAARLMAAPWAGAPQEAAPLIAAPWPEARSPEPPPPAAPPPGPPPPAPAPPEAPPPSAVLPSAAPPEAPPPSAALPSAVPPEAPGGEPRRPASSPGPLTGRMLKHFLVGNRIAVGGMGEVYLAFDTYLERPLAIKTVRAELTQDDVRRALFLREAQAQAKVIHPHVAQVYFAGEEDGVWFIAMQLVDGGSLADVVDDMKRLRWQDAARHMLGLAEGLAEASRLGIIHRDIKPANVLLDRAGEAHLADFGLASLSTRRGAGSPPGPAGMPPGAVMGTLEYMAPEQLRGGPLDFRADMYGLGATFYHLLAGRPPLTASTLKEAAAAHSGPAPRKLRRVAPRVPRALADVIDRCLERDRELRYRSFDELVQALRRALPPPEVPAPALSRAMAWAIDLVPAAAVLRYAYLRFPAGALLAEVLLAVLSTMAVGATPGLWLMRLCLRTGEGGDVSPFRAGFRALVQHGWLLPLCLYLADAYGSSRYAEDWGLAAVTWAVLSGLGSFGTLFGARQTLHDRASGTRVLVDTR